MSSKSDAVVSFLSAYPKAPQFFNASVIRDGTVNVETISNDAYIKKYVDGSAEKEFKFSIVFIKSLSDTPYSDENVEEFYDVESFMEWIDEQNEKCIFPDFGEKCSVIKIENMENIPTITGKDEKLVRYAFNVKITYTERK